MGVLTLNPSEFNVNQVLANISLTYMRIEERINGLRQNIQNVNQTSLGSKIGRASCRERV